MLLLLTVAGTLLALWLIATGLRGKLVGDHPHCRRCGYDLFGQPDSSTVCPECGSALGDRRAKTIGRRQRRPALLILGGVLLLGVIGLVTSPIIQAVQAIDWYHYRPAGWLVADVSASPPNARSLAELIRRCDNATLNDAMISAVVRPALAAQKNRAATWDTHWGQFIESAHRTGRLPDADWTTYLTQAILPVIKLNSDYDLSSPLVLTLNTTSPSLGTRIDLHMDVAITHFAFDGKPADKMTVIADRSVALGLSSAGTFNTSSWFGSTCNLIYAGREIGAGKHTVTADITTTIRARDDTEPAITDWWQAMKPTLVLPSTFTQTFVISNEEPPRSTDASRQAMHDAIHVQAHASPAGIVIKLSTESLPMAMAGHLSVKIDARTSVGVNRGSHFRLLPGNQSIEFEAVTRPELRDRKTLDFILRPDQNVFRSDMGGAFLWKDDIKFEGVPVEPPVSQSP